MTHMIGLETLRPGRAVFDVIGAGVESPRSLSGVATAINFTGGGLVAVEYNNCMPGNMTPAGLKYVSRLAAMLNSGVTKVHVPLLTDFLTPSSDGYQIGDGLTATGSFSDSTTFSDGTGLAYYTVTAEIYAAAALNAGSVQITLFVGDALYGGEWFSLNHANKDKRAYRIKEVTATGTDGLGNTVYTCSISPPLREAVSAGMDANFVRPICTMRLAPGTTIPFNLEPAWLGTFDLKFIEAGWAA